MAISQQEYNTHLQSNRILHIKIDLLNQYNAIVDSLEGIALDGQVNVTFDSLIRRTASVKFILSNSLLPSQQSKLWINNKVRLWTGLENYSGVVFYYCMGTFCIKNPSVDISINERTVFLELADKMYLLSNIPLELITKFNAGIPISDAMRLVVGTLGGETQLSIDTHPYTLPYDLEFTPEQSVLDIVQSLQDMYMNWEAFYDVDGRFIFKEIPNTLNDPIQWDFIDKADFRINSQVSVAYDNIKNHIKVIGKTLNDGTTATAISENTNINSSFSIAKIGKKSLVISDSKYFTNTQCQANADYQLFKHSNFNEKFNISSIPIYFLDVEKNVNFNSPEDNLEGIYCVSSLGIPLKFDGMMSISGYRVY